MIRLKPEDEAGVINTVFQIPETGEYLYRVMINRTFICYFLHKREDGLAVCLEKAAEAVRLSQEVKNEK